MVNLWFEGMCIMDVKVRKEMLCGMSDVVVTKDGKYVGRLDTVTHRLVCKKGLTGKNYKVEKRA